MKTSRVSYGCSGLPILFALLWVASWCLQFFAVAAGIKAGFGAEGLAASILSIIAAFFVAGIPFVGTIAGLIGAVYGWHWSFFSALMLFFWPFILPIVFTLVRLIVAPSRPAQDTSCDTDSPHNHNQVPPSQDVIDV